MKLTGNIILDHEMKAGLDVGLGVFVRLFHDVCLVCFVLFVCFVFFFVWLVAFEGIVSGEKDRNQHSSVMRNILPILTNNFFSREPQV